MSNYRTTTQHNTKLVDAKRATKLLGVHARTLRNWERAGTISAVRGPGNVRLYNLDNFLHTSGDGNSGTIGGTASQDRKNVIYARVSSQKQKADLGRQIQALQEEFSGYEVISDVGSGINFKRRGLKKLVQCCLAGEIGTVVVAHRDRLSRLAFDFFEWLFNSVGTDLVVAGGNDSGAAERDELGEDLMSIVHVFSCRAYGRRKYARKHGGGEDGGGEDRRSNRKRPRSEKAQTGKEESTTARGRHDSSLRENPGATVSMEPDDPPAQGETSSEGTERRTQTTSPEAQEDAKAQAFAYHATPLAPRRRGRPKKRAVIETFRPLPVSLQQNAPTRH